MNQGMRTVSSRPLHINASYRLSTARTLTVTLSIRFISHAFSQLFSPSFFVPLPLLLAVLLAGEIPFAIVAVWC